MNFYETVADMYSIDNRMVDCNAFLEALESASAMAEFNRYFFGQVDYICKSEKLNSLEALF